MRSFLSTHWSFPHRLKDITVNCTFGFGSVVIVVKSLGSPETSELNGLIQMKYVVSGSSQYVVVEVLEVETVCAGSAETGSVNISTLKLFAFVGLAQARETFSKFSEVILGAAICPICKSARTGADDLTSLSLRALTVT